MQQQDNNAQDDSYVADAPPTTLEDLIKAPITEPVIAEDDDEPATGESEVPDEPDDPEDMIDGGDDDIPEQELEYVPES